MMLRFFKHNFNIFIDILPHFFKFCEYLYVYRTFYILKYQYMARGPFLSA